MSHINVLNLIDTFLKKYLSLTELQPAFLCHTCNYYKNFHVALILYVSKNNKENYSLEESILWFQSKEKSTIIDLASCSDSPF